MDPHNAALIEQFKPLLREADFDLMFEQLCGDLPQSERFLLKMELTRLNQESRQALDLRQHSPLPCNEVEIGGVRHYLDRPNAERLRQLVGLYGDRLTVGAVEELLSQVQSHQLIDQMEDADGQPLLPGHCHLLPLGHYTVRKEQRRTFATEVMLAQQGDPIHGLTLDLSVRGCRIRTESDLRLDPERPVTLYFTALSKEYVIPALDLGVRYDIVGKEHQKGFLVLRLKRAAVDPNQDQELSRVLQASALRTTPELNHLVATTRSHGYERHLLPTLSTLPIALQRKEGRWQTILALKTKANQATWHYWDNERGASQLSAVLTDSRINRLLREPDNPAHTLLYSFQIKQKEQVLFFSATVAELLHNGDADAFLALASRQPSFRLHQLGYQSLKEADLRRALRDPISNQPFDPLVCQQFQHVRVLLTLQPLDGAEPQYFSQRPQSDDPNTLRRYGMSRVNDDPIQAVFLALKERRREPRFRLSSAALLTFDRQSWPGTTLDISPNGIKLRLQQPAALTLGEEVLLALPKLQSLAGKLKLSAMPYQVVGIQRDQRTLRLKALRRETHMGVVFLSHLLSKNRDKLPQVGGTAHHHQLIEGMKNFTLRQLHPVPFFSHKSGNRHQIDTIGFGAHPSLLFNALIGQVRSEVDLSWLLLNRHLTTLLTGLRQQAQSQALEVAIKLPREGEPAEIMAVEDNSKGLREFILEGIVRRRFLGLRIELHPAGKPDLDYLQQDLAAISGHALHRARELEDALWQVQGCGQMLDISQDLMVRCQLESLIPPMKLGEQANN